MRNPEYKFFVTVNPDDPTSNAVEVHPVWKDDLAVEWATESGQWFLRSSLSGSIDLIREDYDLIMAQPFGTVYRLELLISKSAGWWQKYWSGRFSLTDCTVNVEDRKLTVKAQTEDDYTDLLAGMEKEYDLIKLLPRVEKVQITKRPMVQIYSEDDSIISCFCGTTYFEEDVSMPSVDDVQEYLIDHCHFAKLSGLVEVNFINNPPEAFRAPFTGMETNGAYWTNSIGTYRLKYFEFTDMDGLIRKHYNGLRVVPANGDTVLWEYAQVNNWQYKPLEAEMEFEPKDPTVTGTLDAVRTSHYTYGRIVCNVERIGSVVTKAIERDDLVTYNRNYRYATPYLGTSELYTNWQGKSAIPTEWGMDDNGQYFTQPNDDHAYMPVGHSKWVNTSDWFRPGSYTQNIDLTARYQYTLNDAYPLASCISVLLREIAPDISFEPVTAYSEFLFSQTDPIAHRKCHVLITPKSNITAGEYQTPAMTAPVTLKAILDMLAKTFNLRWMIEQKYVGSRMQKCLVIEHVEWFRNGGSYNVSPSVGFDITALQNIRNGRMWSYGQSSYSFEKADMPERYEFGWMDEVTAPFKGQPIEVLSKFVEKGKIENVDVAMFTSDIDLMLLNPQSISPDGFAVMTSEDGALPFVSYVRDNIVYSLQNGYMAFGLLQNPYWLYDMPSKALKVNGFVVNPQSVRVSRRKAQTVNVPYGSAEPDLSKLIRTGIGEGQIRQLSLRLTSRMAKVQLRFDTE